MTTVNLFSSTLLAVSYGLTLFHPVRATLDSSSCAFPNGEQATGYVVCNPTAAQSSCCFEGEACLRDGLCYGAIGFMYRGACAGGWGNSTACPDYCSTVAGLDGSWANILPCYSNDSAPSYDPEWWCGQDTACNLDVANAAPTRNSIFTLPFYGKAATNILANGTTSPGCSSPGESTTTSGSIVTVTVTTTASAASSNDLCAVHSNALPSGAIAGLAVLGAVALFSIGWALWENRARRRQGRTVSNGAFEQPRYGQTTQVPVGAIHGNSSYHYHQENHEADGRMLPHEMDARDKSMIAER